MSDILGAIAWWMIAAPCLWFAFTYGMNRSNDG